MCKRDGTYAVWKLTDDPSFSCDKHLGEVVLAVLSQGGPKKVNVSISPAEAPCIVDFHRKNVRVKR